MLFLKTKNNISFFSLLILFSILNFIKQNKIVFPFKTQTSKTLSSNYIDLFIQNKIYTTIEIGTPPKSINIYLTMDTNYLIISNSSIDPSFYNNKKSNTYFNISQLNVFYFEYFSNGYYAKDSFLFMTTLENQEKVKFNNIEFIHAIEFSSENYISPGYFGLQIPKKNKLNIYNCLKKENVISKEFWSLKYTNDNEGYFIIGEFPPEYNDENSIQMTNALPCEGESSYLCWNLKFNEIKFGDISVNRDRTAKIYPEFEFIIGTGEYEQKISENFFNKLNNKCQKKLSETYYYYFECEKDIDISIFKNLEFSHSEFMYNFIMTKDDLFKLYNNKLYFLIIFNMYSSYGNYWKLGKPFIKKYNFGYNIDNNKILFFNKEEKKEDEEQVDSNIYYYIIIGILAICALFMIFFVIIKKFLKPKRKKANELQEEINIAVDENDKNQNILGI